MLDTTINSYTDVKSKFLLNAFGVLKADVKFEDFGTTVVDGKSMFNADFISDVHASSTVNCTFMLQKLVAMLQKLLTICQNACN